MRNNCIEKLGDKHYLTRYVDICRNCKGGGRVANLCHCAPTESIITCPVCGGSGRVVICKDISVTVEPYHSFNT